MTCLKSAIDALELCKKKKKKQQLHQITPNNTLLVSKQRMERITETMTCSKQSMA